MTWTVGGSAACTREAEPPQEHDLAPAKSRGTGEEPSHEEQRGQSKAGGVSFIRIEICRANQRTELGLG